jgi:hypothetical protein
MEPNLSYSAHDWTVIEATEQSAASVRSTGGGSSVVIGNTIFSDPVRIRSTVSVWQNLFLRSNNNGKEISVRINQTGFARAGSRIRYFFANGSNINKCMAIKNLDTGVVVAVEGSDYGSIAEFTRTSLGYIKLSVWFLLMIAASFLIKFTSSQTNNFMGDSSYHITSYSSLSISQSLIDGKDPVKILKPFFSPDKPNGGKTLAQNLQILEQRLSLDKQIVLCQKLFPGKMYVLSKTGYCQPQEFIDGQGGRETMANIAYIVTLGLLISLAILSYTKHNKMHIANCKALDKFKESFPI